MYYVRWDHESGSIVRGPQETIGAGDNWYPFVEAGRVENPRTQRTICEFNPNIQAVVMRVEGSYELLYDQKRAAEYASLREQLDMLWHDINNGTLDQTGVFYNHIKSIKDAHPKPEV